MCQTRRRRRRKPSASQACRWPPSNCRGNGRGAMWRRGRTAMWSKKATLCPFVLSSGALPVALKSRVKWPFPGKATTSTWTMTSPGDWPAGFFHAPSRERTICFPLTFDPVCLQIWRRGSASQNEMLQVKPQGYSLMTVRLQEAVFHRPFASAGNLTAGSRNDGGIRWTTSSRSCPPWSRPVSTWLRSSTSRLSCERPCNTWKPSKATWPHTVSERSFRYLLSHAEALCFCDCSWNRQRLYTHHPQAFHLSQRWTQTPSAQGGQPSVSTASPGGLSVF